MALAWAQRREELLNDCIVSPDVFNPMIDCLATFVRPYQQVYNWPNKKGEDFDCLVVVQRQVIQEVIGTVPWDHRPLIEVLVPQVVHRLGGAAGKAANLVGCKSPRRQLPDSDG